MIKYALQCEDGHTFESWFQSGPAFDAQASSGLIGCPVCQSSAVTKAIMAPALTRGGREMAPVVTGAPVESSVVNKGTTDVALLGPADAERRAMIVELRRRILEHSSDLGAKFAEEALKIHHGLVADRPIHGQATLEEARLLLEEGVNVMPIPNLPGELN
jgi:hypothetical protein